MLVDQIRLHEQLMLLALSNEQGTLALKEGKLRRAMACGIMAELLKMGRIDLSPEEADGVVSLRSDDMEDELLQECPVLIRDSEKIRPVTYWVSRISRFPKLRRRVAMGLCRLGILEHSEETVFLFFNREKFPEVNPEPEQALVCRLREAVLGERTDLDLETTLILMLCTLSGLLSNHFDREDLDRRRERIELVASGRLLEESASTPSQIRQAQSLKALAHALGQSEPEEMDGSTDDAHPEFAAAS